MLPQLTALIAAIIAAISPLKTLPQSGQFSFQSTPANISSAPPELSAESVFLIDTQRGNILFRRNADSPRPIASITKLMAALTLSEYVSDWSAPLTFKASDGRAGDINRLIVGEEITVQDAWNLMLVGSSNDAVALLGRTIGGGEEKLVAEMNKKAKELGLTKTTFVEPTGLNKGNISTAREVAAFVRAALIVPEIRAAVSKSEFSFVPRGKSARTVLSTNQLLSSFEIPGVKMFGGKTGHIEESKYNLAFAAGNDKREFVGIVLGSENNEARFADMRRLLSWGFSATPELQSLGD